MIHSLNLKQFKNFKDASLRLGPLTVLIGANSSGKSNIRDAFRFLHGIGRGYNLAEILGEKYVGGERVWSGIRGGTREVAYSGFDSFSLGVEVDVSFPKLKNPGPFTLHYSTEVKLSGPQDKPPRVLCESLYFKNTPFFKNKQEVDKNNLKVVFYKQKKVKGKYPPFKDIFFRNSYYLSGRGR